MYVYLYIYLFIYLYISLIYILFMYIFIFVGQLKIKIPLTGRPFLFAESYSLHQDFLCEHKVCVTFSHTGMKALN